MPLTDQDRIARDRTAPRIVALWQALSGVKSCVSFMQSGAHPDDETSAMLAALRFRDGLDIAYACANRGEGGQNDIGTEATEALGVLRTAEMERAADVLDMGLYWLSEGPDDPIFDFGFSKSGVETLGRWGRDRTLARLVDILRRAKPDALCPTFLDISGQHGHHRAMTETAHRAVAAAADPSFAGCDLPPWQVSKLYLPAWSGAGGAYDDEVPPPPATLTVPGRGVDPVTGWSWEGIGQQSRAFHKTQGMGRWVALEDERDWPLHLAFSVFTGPDDAVTDGLPGTMADLDAGAAQGDLAATARAMEDARDAFPDAVAIRRSAAEALRRVRAARGKASAAFLAAHGHRLAQAEMRLARVLMLAAGVDARGRVADDWLRPGEQTALMQEERHGEADAVSVSVSLPEGWEHTGDGIGPSTKAQPSDPYPATYLPWAPPDPALEVRVSVDGVDATCRVPLELTPVTLPARSAQLRPARAVLNTTLAARIVSLRLSEVSPAGADPSLSVPDGWQAAINDQAVTVTAPDDVMQGAHQLALHLDDAPASTVTRIAHPHTTPRALCVPATLTVLTVNAALPRARIAYVGGGNDRVAHWLAALGLEVTELDNATVADPSGLADFTTLVVGIFAMKTRPALRAAMPRLHRWVAEGGTLLTLYHRPWDAWDPDTVPPKRLEIGQPSLRWRVTDEAAEVAHLLPDHPLLTTPNRIGPEDWDGWHKERGLYFAKSWDEAYQPLLEMADPDEAPHRGALLSAEIGQGRHTHCALILHHQMEKLTPGAFRLMANLVAPRG